MPLPNDTTWTLIPIPGAKRGDHRLFRNDSERARQLHPSLRLFLSDGSGKTPDECDDGALRIPRSTMFELADAGNLRDCIAIDVCGEGDPDAPDPELDGNPDGRAWVSTPVARAIAAYHGIPFRPKV